MAKILGLPKLSPTMDQGTLVRWAKKEGDAIEIDDLLAEVETDKATMEFRSFDKGVLLKRLAAEGATLAPDEPVAIIGNAGEDISKLEAQAGGAKTAPAAPAAPSGAAAPAGSAKPATAAPPPAGAATGAKPASPGPSANTPSAKSDASVAMTTTSVSTPAPVAPAPLRADGRVLASPVVRKVARERGIDLAVVHGSGPNGRIIKRDVDTLPVPVATSLAVYTPGESRIVPLSQMRRTIARRLTESKQQVPHFYLTMDVDAGPLNKARQMLNAELEASGEKVSLNDLVVKACAVALRRVPEVNASFMGDSIAFHDRVDISVAVSIPDGLLTPVVRNADAKGVREIAHEIRALAARAKEKKLKPEEMTNGTFSVSNLGMFGVEDFAAVINPPEGAILAVGALRQEPVVRDGAIVPGERMRMTMSCDHRVVDGALGARWLQALRGLLEKPVTMLL